MRSVRTRLKKIYDEQGRLDIIRRIEIDRGNVRLKLVVRHKNVKTRYVERRQNGGPRNLIIENTRRTVSVNESICNCVSEYDASNTF